jgi:hypothetical protein
MPIEIDNETKIIAILSGYNRELREGKDYLQTTYSTAKTIVEICKQPDSILGIEVCTGCGMTNKETIPNGKLCCPDNNYISLKRYLSQSIYKPKK